jgi:hypothetical protein
MDFKRRKLEMITSKKWTTWTKKPTNNFLCRLPKTIIIFWYYIFIFSLLSNQILLIFYHLSAIFLLSNHSDTLYPTISKTYPWKSVSYHPERKSYFFSTTTIDKLKRWTIRSKTGTQKAWTTTLLRRNQYPSWRSKQIWLFHVFSKQFAESVQRK